jgi:hypothetical protein
MWGVFVCVAFVCVVSLFFKKKSNYQIEIPLSATDALDTIFVGVIVHPGEESDCARMLHTLFEKAVAANRIHVGILHYVSEEGRTPGGIGMSAYFCNVRAQYDRICIEYGSRRQSFKVIRRRVEDDQGREVSRAEMKKYLFGNEKYWCEIYPSHRSANQWDSHAVECIHMAGPKSILTTEPGDLFTHRPTYPVVVGGDLDEHRFPQLEPKIYAEEPTKPFKVPLMSPAFVFAPSEIILTCPPEPRFAYCDHADVLVRSARYATHGWTFYAPHKVLVHRNRTSPVDNDVYRHLPMTTATTTEARRLRTLGVHAVLSVLGEDACSICGKRRSEHTTSVTLNHPFEAMKGALSDRGHLIGNSMSLKTFRKQVGVWINKRPGRHASCGVVRRKNISNDERKAKHFYDVKQPDADFA